MSNLVKDFNDYRTKMNDKILGDNNKIINYIYTTNSKNHTLKTTTLTQL